jgi:hypothetical protein
MASPSLIAIDLDGISIFELRDGREKRITRIAHVGRTHATFRVPPTCAFILDAAVTDVNRLQP